MNDPVAYLCVFDRFLHIGTVFMKKKLFVK